VFCLCNHIQIIKNEKMSDNQKNYKTICLDFLQLTANGESRKAFELYVGQGFKHHNAYFKGDANTLMLAMEENGKKFPDIVLKTIHLLQEDDTVAVHSHIKMKPDDLGYSMMHIFRFENDRIIEI
jgi:predicted SnoaL-like aldol condensation-catalyzing enzyme